MHACIWVSAAVAAAVPLFYRGYNPQCGFCNPTPLPRWCGEGLFGDGTTECVRGSPTIPTVYLAIFGLLVVVATVFCTGAMVVIYRTVHKQELRLARLSFLSRQNHTMSKSIRTRMLLYTSSFYVCWLLPVLCVYVLPSPPTLELVAYALAPLMGWFNMLAFILPRCQKYQKNHAGTRLPMAYFHVLFDAPIAAVTRCTASRSSVVRSGGPVGAENGRGLVSGNARVEASGDGTGVPAGGETALLAGEAVGAAETLR